MMMTHGVTTETDWEARWAPYDMPTYREALGLIQPAATVLDIGAGDLRFARLLARRADFVYAIEYQLELLTAAHEVDFPANVEVICADARITPFPDDIDTAVLLMRHCREFGRYVRKLRFVGCRWLVTNARWGFGVELIDLDRQALPFVAVSRGWYACRCGNTGFRDCPPEDLNMADLRTIAEVATCPVCRPVSLIPTYRSGALPGW